jgi:ABC-2 type transport system ATP-binding protein
VEPLADLWGESEDAADPDVPALAVEHLRKGFGATTAVADLSWEIAAGTFYGIVGPNGAGKTTTLSMIAGLLRPDSGTIRIHGVDIRAHEREAKRLIGVLPDRLRTFDRLTGRQLLTYAGLLRGLPGEVVEERAAALARALDLTDALGRVVGDYSAGMTKKVMLAVAMIHAPRLLVLDEPFEALDPVSTAAILDILRAYTEHGGTVVLSSHGIDLIERVCDRVAVLAAGQLLAEGTVDELRGESTLAERFVEIVGAAGEAEGLEWLHTFSG